MTAAAYRIVHEGRGGYIDVGGRRYDIEHVEGGRFCIYFPGGHRGASADLAVLQELVASDPTKWALDDRSRGQ